MNNSHPAAAALRAAGPVLTPLSLLALAALVTARVVRARRHFDLAGRVVVVTGGSRGLGLETCRQFLRKGARVATFSRTGEQLDAALAELRAAARSPADVFGQTCDVTRDADVRDFFDAVRRHLGPVDVLVNNAGTIGVGPGGALDMDDYDQAIETNLRGPIRTILQVLPDMRRRGSGRIVNISSVGGLVGVPHLAAYSAAKHGLVGLSTALRADVLRDGVYVSVVCPGMVRTGSPPNALFKGDQEAEYAWFAAGDNTPGITISAPDMAAAVVRATETGDAVVVEPRQTRVAAALYGLTRGVGAELAGVFERFALPADPGTGGPAGAGRDLGVTLPEPLEARQRRLMDAHNQNN